jgi:hypothetical protein
MRKKDETSHKHTCLAHAHPEEMVFVLLSRDAAAPIAIRAWVNERLRLGKNVESDDQIVEALACAQTMEIEGRKWVSAAMHSFSVHDCVRFLDDTGCVRVGDISEIPDASTVLVRVPGWRDAFRVSIVDLAHQQQVGSR